MGSSREPRWVVELLPKHGPSRRTSVVPGQTFSKDPFETILRKEAIADHALPPEA